MAFAFFGLAVHLPCRESWEFQTIFRSGNDPVTIVDLTAVPYMDSAALGAVISVHTTAQTHRRAYALAGVSERLHTLINVAGVGGILVTCPSLEEAEEKFASRAVSS